MTVSVVTATGEASARTPLPKYTLVRRVSPSERAPELDEAQAAVVSHRDGPLLVLGGPGTGKTTALVEAVAARVTEGTEPDRILVLTFGRRAAAALRNAIEVRIGRHRATMSEPIVRTFPAYAFGLLGRAAAGAGQPPPRLLTGAEQDAVIRDLLAAPQAGQRWPESLRPALGTRAFAAELRDLLLRCAERGIGPGSLARLGRQLDRPDWVAAADFMREYQQVLALREASTRGNAAYDQAELVRAAAALLTDDPVLHQAERDRCRYAYVDELADTDPAQIDLLGLVVAGHVVGFADPDSSTFAFRGADPSGVRDFTERFRAADRAEAPTVVLATGYRAVPELVAATRGVAARLRGPVRHRAVVPHQRAAEIPAERACGPAGGLPAVEVCTLRSATSEAAYLAHRLREAHLHHGIPWSRMAVIVRSLRHQQAGLRRALTQAGIPTSTVAEDIALATAPAVAPILLLFRCALDPSGLDEPAAVRLLHSPLGGADPFIERQLRQGLRAIALAAGDRRPSGDLLVEALRDERELAAIDQRWARPARAVAGLMAIARRTASTAGASAEDVLWAVWRASGLADRWAAASARGGRRGSTADRDLDAVMVLFDAAARFTDRLPGARIEAFLDHLLDQQLPADTLAATADQGEAVRILTAHAAKGLEWDVVAVAGVQEGVWPDLRLRGSVLGSERLVDVASGRGSPAASRAVIASQVAALLDEERRLFYVATTRARRALLVCAVDASSSGTGGDEQPSRFLAELGGPAAVPETELPAAGAPEAGAPTVSTAEPAEPTGQGAVPAGPDGERLGEDVQHISAELPHEPGVRLVTRLPRPLTLPALVAELRAVAADQLAALGLRQAAATELARLADAGVAGADPDQWWGLRPVSDPGPLVDGDDAVRVSPSTVESVLRCGLRWLLERHGGNDPATAKQGIGNLVHDAARLAGATGADAAALRAHVLAHFDLIELPARWLGERERERASAMIEKLVRWAAANSRQLIDVERGFQSLLPAPATDAVIADPSAAESISAGRTTARDDGHPVLLTGRVDRLERDAAGRLVVVDLKTGAGAPAIKEVAAHAQLAAYQVAVQAGAFEEGTAPGGAEIVALGTASADPVVRHQPPLAEADDPGWAEALVRRGAAAMAAARFTAVVNDSCGYCAVRTACPLSGKGRQVTDG